MALLGEGLLNFSSSPDRELEAQLQERVIKALQRVSDERSQGQKISEAIKEALREVQREPLREQFDSSKFDELFRKYLNIFVNPMERFSGSANPQELMAVLQQSTRAYELLGEKNYHRFMEEANKYATDPQSLARTIQGGTIPYLFQTMPREAAKKFLAGELSVSDLEQAGPAVSLIGPGLRKEYSNIRATKIGAEDLDIDEKVSSFLGDEIANRAKKLTTYLQTLNTTFDKTLKELEAAEKAGDSKNAAELRKTLSALSRELVETKKELQAAEEEAREKRRQAWSDLGSALSPIGRHAEGSLQNPMFDLFKESISVGLRAMNATSNLLQAGQGGGVSGFGAATAAQGARGMLSRAGSWAAKAIPAAIRFLGTKPSLYTMGAATALWGGYELYKYFTGGDEEETVVPEDIQNAGIVGGIESSRRNLRIDANGKLVWDDSTEKAAENVKKLGAAASEASESLSNTGNAAMLLTMGIGGLAGSAIVAKLGIPGVSSAAGALTSMGVGAAAFTGNFLMGSIDIGRQYLDQYWQRSTGLNMQQYLAITGGAQSTAALLQGGVYNNEALRLGFSPNAIIQGYEIMQRQMPTGGLGANDFNNLMEQNARLARALGIRLEESLQLSSQMRLTFGSADLNQFGGYMAAVGADRTGNFESAFSRSITQAFVDASRQLMMMGVAPEASMQGFGVLRNIYMSPNQPEYLRTLFETNPGAVTNISNTFSSMLRSGAAGSNPWAAGLGLRAGLGFEEMARGGPEATIALLNELMAEVPLGLEVSGGKLNKPTREMLSMFSAQLGLNPDILIGYAEAYARGDVQAAEAQFRASYQKGRVWEGGLTTEGLQRGPMEEALAVQNRAVMTLASETEKYLDYITQFNTLLLEAGTAVLKFADTLVEGAEQIASILQLDRSPAEAPEQLNEPGTQQRPGTSNRTARTTQPTSPEERGEVAAEQFREMGGFVPSRSFVSGGNVQTVLVVNGKVDVWEKVNQGFNPER